MELLDFFFQIGFVLFLLALGFGVGRHREKKHLRQLDSKEEELRGIGITNRKRLPRGAEAACRGLVTGSVVIATDYFKVFASSLRNLFGGEMRTLGTLVTRARREALVRMMTEAGKLGANAVINVRLETSTIGGQQQKKSGGIEVLAYGTALRVTEHAKT